MSAAVEYAGKSKELGIPKHEVESYFFPPLTLLTLRELSFYKAFCDLQTYREAYVENLGSHYFILDTKNTEVNQTFQSLLSWT